APVEGGSMTAASCGSAVKEVAEKVRGRLLDLARDVPDSPFAGAKQKDVIFADGCMAPSSEPTMRWPITDVMRRSGTGAIEESTTSLRTFATEAVKQRNYVSYAHSAVFVEVGVDEE